MIGLPIVYGLEFHKMNDIIRLFSDLLNSTEVRKVDFKRDQYLLTNETLKSEFVKDLLCIANSPGEDGYILLGVKAVKGKPREITGISSHYDSSDLEQLVNSVVEDPVQFEYHSLTYKGVECGLLQIPKSKAKPHWPKKNFGVLRKHVIYTRRASGNREASMPEIREMFLSTIHISDIAQRKIRSSPHVIDELSNMNLDERTGAMFSMLKSIAPKLGLIKPFTLSLYSRQLCTMAANNNLGSNYTFFMYPWTVPAYDIIHSRHNVANLVLSADKKRPLKSERERLKSSTLVHVSYKGISTKPLESKYYSSTFYRLANAWKVGWGTIMKWEGNKLKWVGNESIYEDEVKFEFFLPDVISKEELQERLGKLLGWVDENVIVQKITAK